VGGKIKFIKGGIIMKSQNYSNFKVAVPIVDPNVFIQSAINEYRPDIFCDDLIEELRTHLDNFLSTDGVLYNLDLGGIYSCEVFIRGEVSLWTFKIHAEDDFCPLISLFPTSNVTEGKKWFPHKA
jgi:hypothetical protein